MQRIIAKRELWVLVEHCCGGIVIKVSPELWQLPVSQFDNYELIHLQVDDVVQFEHVAKESNPYAMLVEQYPDYFERE